MKRRAGEPAHPRDGGHDGGDARPFARTPYLAAVMRHELCGTLNSMAMTAGLLGERAKKGMASPVDVAELAARIGRQIERATAILDHYVEFTLTDGVPAPAGGERGPAALADEREDTGVTGGQELGRMIGALRTVAADGSIRITTESPPDPPDVAIPARALEYALAHVVGFAMTHTPEGGEIKIQISLDETDVTIDIQHQGGPLTVDDLHVFEHGPREIEARLVDLAVARRIMTDAGGELTPRQGAFWIRVPRADA